MKRYKIEVYRKIYECAIFDVEAKNIVQAAKIAKERSDIWEIYGEIVTVHPAKIQSIELVKE